MVDSLHRHESVHSLGGWAQAMTTKKEGSEAFQMFNSKDLKMQSVCLCVFACVRAPISMKVFLSVGKSLFVYAGVSLSCSITIPVISSLSDFMCACWCLVLHSCDPWEAELLLICPRRNTAWKNVIWTFWVVFTLTAGSIASNFTSHYHSCSCTFPLVAWDRKNEEERGGEILEETKQGH